MQLSFFKTKTVITYPTTGGAETIAREIFRGLGARLELVDGLSEARRVRYDALLLLGGPDINPFFYGEEKRHCRNISKQRDLTEWTMVRRALGEGKPVLGICRGMQMLAVATGGSLYQDLAAQRVARFHPRFHQVTVANSLRDLVPTTYVNSRHHQAVKTVPPGFKLLATAPDKVIEAVGIPRKALGVQWHPEDLFLEDARWRGLFAWLVGQ